jgi:hypothetical protein
MIEFLNESIPTQPPPIAIAIIQVRLTRLVCTIGKIRMFGGRGMQVESWFHCHPVSLCVWILPTSLNGIDIEMRIGTWNVENRLMTKKHRELLGDQQCDVWLLTEIHRSWADEPGTKVLHFHSHLSKEVMGRKQHWAAVLSVLPLKRLRDPHPASAAAVVNGITYCSTILPWRGVKAASEPWEGSNHAEMTAVAIQSLLSELPKKNLVWGGDWNHSLIGKESAGSMGGRTYLLEAIKKLALNVPTSVLSHRGDYCTAIDHIGVPLTWKVDSAKRINADGLSDHDAYVVEV